MAHEIAIINEVDEKDLCDVFIKFEETWTHSIMLGNRAREYLSYTWPQQVIIRIIAADAYSFDLREMS